VQHLCATVLRVALEANQAEPRQLGCDVPTMASAAEASSRCEDEFRDRVSGA
jgi:hypothetical protein